MSFAGKVVVVTGASSGIGATTAIEFTEQAAKVVIVGRNQANLDSIAEECQKYGDKPVVINADLVKEDDTKRVIDETIKAYGKIDVLVNSAGISKLIPFGDEGTLNLFDTIIAINLRAMVQLTNLAVPYLEKTKGNVVIVSGVGSLKVVSGWANCTAKAGLDHFSRCIAAELAPKGIRVNVVNPGPVRTNIFTTMGIKDLDSFYKRLEGMTTLGRISEPQEISDVILFLASDKAKGVTGANWVTDNGMMIKQ